MKSSLPPFWERFSFSHEEIEGFVPDREGSYQKLAPEALYTSDEDLKLIFQSQLVTGTFCDLGCGTGRTALLYALLFPERRAIGIEREEARLEVGRSFLQQYHVTNVQLVCGDLLKADIPTADTYFLYFPTGQVLDRMLSCLYNMQHDFRLVVIEAHGDLLPRIELENWLSFQEEIRLSSLRHYPAARIYERTHDLRKATLLPFDLSFQEKFLEIKEGDETWIGESQKLEWLQHEQFNLAIPPRTIEWSSVQKVITSAEISPDLHKVLEMRRLGELEITTCRQTYRGFIRKIITSPFFQLEISSGEKVEWKDIRTVRKGNVLCYDISQLS